MKQHNIGPAHQVSVGDRVRLKQVVKYQEDL